MDHILVELPHIAAAMPVTDCPEGQPSQLHSIVSQGLGALRALDGKAGNLFADKELSDEGKISRLAADCEAVAKAITSQQEAVRAIAAELAGQEKSFYAPPALEPTDAVGALADRERRDWFTQLPADRRATVLREMSQGKHEELLVALARCPVPLAWEDAVQSAWRDKVEKKHPTKTSNFARRRETLDWAHTMLRGLADRAPTPVTIERRLRQSRAA